MGQQANVIYVTDGCDAYVTTVQWSARMDMDLQKVIRNMKDSGNFPRLHASTLVNQFFRSVSQFEHIAYFEPIGKESELLPTDKPFVAEDDEVYGVFIRPRGAGTTGAAKNTPRDMTSWELMYDCWELMLDGLDERSIGIFYNESYKNHVVFFYKDPNTGALKKFEVNTSYLISKYQLHEFPGWARTD